MLTCITQLEEVVFFFEPVYIDAFDFTNSRAVFSGMEPSGWDQQS